VAATLNLDSLGDAGMSHVGKEVLEQAIHVIAVQLDANVLLSLAKGLK
jgi:hypothetical protein